MVVKENTNRIIAYNSAILYVQLAVSTICGFFTIRFVLRALGVDDYGLFALLGSIISMIDVVNTIMVKTTTRFLTVAIGKGNPSEINKQFNINLTIHAAIAVLTLLAAFPIGFWYIGKHLNYAGDIHNAYMVFTFSIIGSIITFIGVPYSGLLRAKENFLATVIPSIISSVVRLFIAIALVYVFSHKLFVYSLTTAFFTAFPTLYFIVYCHRKYPTFVKIKKSFDWPQYKSVLGFSGWIGYGTAATIAKSQGAAILINSFFTTAMNAALGVANTINSYITNFTQNMTLPMLPQITKSYATGNKKRCDELLCMTTKFSFLLMLFISSPFLIDATWSMELLLGRVPQYATYFTILIIIDHLVNTFNHGIETIIFASGKIALYQFVSNTLRLIALVVAYFVLKSGASQFSLYYTYIGCTTIIIILNQYIIHKVLNYDNRILIKNSYLYSILVVVLFVPYLFIPKPFHPAISIIIGMAYLSVIIYFCGLKKVERQYVLQLAKSIFGKVKTVFKLRSR